MLHLPSSFSGLRLGGACLLLAGVVGVAAGCHKRIEFEYIDEEEESQSVVVQTDENGLESALPAGADLGVYLVGGDGNVSLSHVLVGEDGTAVLPAVAAGESLIVYSPYQEDWGVEAYYSNPVFAVAQDQSTAEAYASSDLMMGVYSPETRAEGPEITFSHMLSKIAVNIIDDIGLSDLNKVEVSLVGAYTSVTVDLPHQEVRTVEIRRSDIRMYSHTASDWRISSLAIVAPHDLVAATPLVSVNLYGDHPQVFLLPEDVHLAGGSTYSVNIRLTQQGLIPDGWSITDWDDQGENYLYPDM